MFLVNGAGQADIDRLREALGDGGSYNVCRFGLSWQTGHAGWPELMAGDAAKSERVKCAR